MAKKNNKKNNNKKSKSNFKGEGLFKLLAATVKELGLPGFLVVVAAFVFLNWGTSIQKQEFVDRFILLKNDNKDMMPCVYIVSFLLLVIVLETIYFRKTNKAKREELKRIGQEKSDLQELLLNKKLHSSK